MEAMVLTAPGRPLQAQSLPPPRPLEGQVLVRVAACAVCRTDLHVVDGELAQPKLPLVPGHEIVGTVEALGEGVELFSVGDRVGVPWLGWTCGACTYCRSGRENLCVRARFTGRDIDGGFADHALADERYCLPVPAGYPDLQAAPLLCGGLIGYRALRMCGDAERLGLYGFGAAAHIICQVAVWQGRRVSAFTRAGDDVLSGGPGNDWLRPGAGRDRALGDSGNDFVGARDGRADRLFGGRGADRARVDRRLDTRRSISSVG